MMNVFLSVFSAIIAVMSLALSYVIYMKSRTDSSYLDIDKQYSELLKLGMADTNLRDYEKTSSFYKLDDGDPFKKKYNIYAYMCWNMVETIFDRQKTAKGRFNLCDTWLPVMFEENRLHYSWYKHNLRLFKPDFQKFVTEVLNDIEIVEGTIDDLHEITERFETDFPSNELKSIEHIEMLMLKKKYSLLLAKHKVFDIVIGYAFVYEITNLNILWLDYMAIDAKYQNSGYGTLLFNKIPETKPELNVGIFMEIEIPSEDAQPADNRIKRMRFYQRLGAKKLGVNYFLPTNDGGYPMHLFFRPSPSLKVLPKESIKEAIISVYNYIHSDIANRDEVAKSFISSIADEYFL